MDGVLEDIASAMPEREDGLRPAEATEPFPPVNAFATSRHCARPPVSLPLTHDAPFSAPVCVARRALRAAAPAARAPKYPQRRARHRGLAGDSNREPQRERIVFRGGRPGRGPGAS